MKRKIFILIVLLLSVQTVFSQMTDDDRNFMELSQRLFPDLLEDIYVPGYPMAVGRITYIGKNRIEQSYNDYIRLSQRSQFGRRIYSNDIKLLRAEENAINMLLNRYNTSRGDTFCIVLNAIRYEYCMYIILEFTTDTRYSYYVWLEN